MYYCAPCLADGETEAQRTSCRGNRLTALWFSTPLLCRLLHMHSNDAGPLAFISTKLMRKLHHDAADEGTPAAIGLRKHTVQAEKDFLLFMQLKTRNYKAKVVTSMTGSFKNQT